MDEPSPELAEPVYIQGKRRRIFAYRAPDGSVPALVFLQGLPADAQGRYAARFKQMGDEGQLQGRYYHPWSHTKSKRAWKRARHANPSLSAFKDNASQSRIPCFPDGPGVLVLTHGFGGKKEDEIEEHHVAEALRIRDDYLDRKADLKKAKTSSQLRRKKGEPGSRRLE